MKHGFQVIVLIVASLNYPPQQSSWSWSCFPTAGVLISSRWWLTQLRYNEVFSGYQHYVIMSLSHLLHHHSTHSHIDWYSTRVATTFNKILLVASGSNPSPTVFGEDRLLMKWNFRHCDGLIQQLNKFGSWYGWADTSLFTVSTLNVEISIWITNYHIVLCSGLRDIITWLWQHYSPVIFFIYNVLLEVLRGEMMSGGRCSYKQQEVIHWW